MCPRVLVHMRACARALVRILPLELVETGGIIIIQRNNKNVGKHLFGIGNISVRVVPMFSCPIKFMKFMKALKNVSKILLY